MSSTTEPVYKQEQQLFAELASELRWPIIDKDDFTDVFHHFNTEAGVGKVDGNEFAYWIMAAVTRRQISQGLSCIVVSPLSRVKHYHTYRTIAEQVRPP